MRKRQFKEYVGFPMCFCLGVPILMKIFMVIEEVIGSNSVAGMDFENLMVQKLSTENRTPI